jgi:hypothetical protein
VQEDVHGAGGAEVLQAQATLQELAGVLLACQLADAIVHSAQASVPERLL